MENFNFNHRGSQVNVNIDNSENGIYFSLPEGMLFREYIINGGADSGQAIKTIDVLAYTRLVNADRDEIKGSVSLNNYKDSVSYDNWYNLPISQLSVPETIGNYINKQRINGLLKKVLGVSCIDIKGNFYQPLNIDVEVTPASVGQADGSFTITVVDGIPDPASSYSIDGGDTWQTGNIFNGLEAGNYELMLKNDAGIISNQTIVIGQAL